MTRILCFGDSITMGYSDPDGGWTLRLQRLLENIYVDVRGNRMHPVMNLGVDADTSSGVLKRLESEASLRAGTRPVIIIAIGTNDSIYHEDGRVRFEIEEYQQNLREIIEKAKDVTDHVVLLGLNPCNEKLMQPMPWSSDGGCYSNKRLASFNSAMKEVAEEKGVPHVDYFNDMLKLDIDVYIADGIHPNSVGHQYIADKLNKLVAKMANNYEEG